MEGRKRIRIPVGVATMMVLVWSLAFIPCLLACPSSKNGKENCRDCIVGRMKYECPACEPILRCMAMCLWDGTSRSLCVKRCDCRGGKPSPSDCKRCMAPCKCSCALYS
uniref:Uncharacterized protein n=1 Tax=Nelumbo nucifera TaxID=4432 RepID=A0A822XIU9_NELNU|nr:TPA_asm: hypothetical protein HUJ06_021793 [Nelumbo nucifera]